MDPLAGRVNVSATSELTIAIVSGATEFARSLMARWQSERMIPGFIALAVEAAFGLLPQCDLVVVGDVPKDRLPQLVKSLDPSARPVICVVEPGEYGQVRESFPHLLLLRRDEYWTDNTVLFAGECLRRRHAVSRALRAEQVLAASQGHTTLGKYVVEMRHNINNALTSVLGNAELVLLNEESFSAETRAQIETIRNTALRLHEIMQRFWSLEAEMKAGDRNWQEVERASWTTARSERNSAAG
jgi:signal transduction histidine kinase